MNPSLSARVFSTFIRAFIRRRDWGDEQHLAARARRLFGAPAIYRPIATRDVSVEPATGRAEWITPSNPEPGVIFYVHGGGFVACSKETHRPVTARLARLSKRRVLSIDYRLAPEHRYPAAIDDVMNAYERLLSTGVSSSQIAVAGDSAGGNLVLSLVIRLRDSHRPLPACIVVFSPWTDLAGTGESIMSNDGHCAMFRPENMDQFARAYLGRGEAMLADASPMHADAHGLPPVLFHVGSTELLLDDSKVMHRRILDAGGESHLAVFDDVPHGWQMLSPFVPEATRSLKEAADFIEKKLQISSESM